MKLYVANGTRQVVSFAYRLPGIPGLKMHSIPVGRQVLVNGGELSSAEVDYIIQSHAKYGLVDCKEVDRTKPFIGMLYSIDKPVPSPKVHAAVAHNTDVLEERGRKNRELAALGSNKILEDSLSENPGLADLAGTEVTITEEIKPGRASDDAPLSEGFHVSRNFSQEQSGKQADRGRGNRNRGK